MFYGHRDFNLVPFLRNKSALDSNKATLFLTHPTNQPNYCHIRLKILLKVKKRGRRLKVNYELFPQPQARQCAMDI